MLFGGRGGYLGAPVHVFDIDDLFLSPVRSDSLFGRVLGHHVAELGTEVGPGVCRFGVGFFQEGHLFEFHGHSASGLAVVHRD